jgi:hypothetical protein
MKFNCIDKNINDLNDQPLRLMSEMLSEILVYADGRREVQKLYALGTGIRKGEIDVDEADMKLIKEVVENFTNQGNPIASSPLVKAQILNEIEAQQLAARAGENKSEKKR